MSHYPWTKVGGQINWMLGLRHPHILPCSLVRNEKGDVFFIERFLEGTLDVRKDFTPVERIGLLRDVCEAVAYLHEKRIIHSDIKPDNIGMEGRNVVLLDFGIASFYASDSHPKDNPGSLKTRAPELFSDSAVVTPASDVWALGATLMALLADGEYPLLGRQDVRDLGTPGDPKRRAVEERVRNLISHYRKNPGEFESRICSLIPQQSSPICNVILKACALDDKCRPSARQLTPMLDKVLRHYSPPVN